MKFKLGFILASFSVLFFWACTTDSPATTESKKYATANSFMSASSSSSFSSHEIGRDSAKLFINKYKGYIDGVNANVSRTATTEYPNPGEKLIYGAKVDLVELLEILEDSRPGDDLYVMMGIMHESDSTEMIFVLDTSSVYGGGSRYFDFTMPCPNACPDSLDTF